MSSSGHQVSRNARWAIAQTIISAAVLFVLYRFLLQELGAEKLGLWSLILASTSLAKIGELGFSSATLRFVGKYVGAGQSCEATEILETALLSIALPFAVLVALAIPMIGSVLPWFVPEKHMTDALAILPWAMLALWLSITSGLVQSAIDGCGRMDQRNMVLIVTNVVYLALAIFLTPMLGLKGVAIAQVAQAGVSLLMMWWLIKAQLTGLPMIPRRWRKHRFREIAGFAVSMQIGSIAGMCVEPITKALISRFGGLEFLAYYEMANQVITRARSVLISGFQAITPQFSITNEPSMHRALFLQSQKKVIDMGIPFMTVLMIAFPLISQIWIGRDESAFIVSGQVIGIAWLLNTLLMPAYFFLTGTGRGFSVAIAHVVTLAGTIALGWAGGHLFGKIGPIIGAAIALLIGNIYLYSIAANGLFRTDRCLAVPKWIAARMLTNGCACFAIIGLNFLATSYANGLVDHLIVFAAMTALTAFLAFSSQTKTIEEQPK
jgi:O-antigen/teichoic acid export membrane protein